MSRKISAHTELTSGNLADGDLIEVVDVSDTTDAASGTNKKSLWSSFKATLKTYFDTLYPTALYLDFPAGAKIPRVTNGAGIDALAETSTNKINADLLVFDAATKEYAQVWFTWPAGWTTCKATFHTIPTSGTGSFVLGAQVRVWSDGDAIDSAFGTAQEVTDAAASANTFRQSPTTSAITPSGTVGDSKRAILQIYRDPANGSDDHPVDLPLLGVTLEKAS